MENAAKRAEFQKLLDSFLLPLRSTLARSRYAFKSLMAGNAGKIRDLEYFSSALRKHFETLPDNRRIFWQVEINQLHAHNDDAIRLIDDYGSGSLLSPGFHQASEDFRRHASTWKSRWNAIIDTTIEANSLPSDRMADPFPAGFDNVVENEIERLRTAASLLGEHNG